MTSIRDIALKSGLSIATVSRYINASGYVSSEAASRIESVIKAEGYIPNQHAKALFNKASRTIGLVFPSLVNPFFAQMSTILGNAVQAAGFSTILCFTEDRAGQEREALDLLKGYRVEGMVICRAINKTLIDQLNFPVVSFETSISPRVVTVRSDNYRGGRMAFEHLYERGCRRLLHLKGPTAFQATQDRCRGFLDAARDRGLQVDVREAANDYALNQNVPNELANIQFDQYDGLFVFNDINCLTTVNHLQRQGFRIPADIKVVGFDNSYLTQFVEPHLTTIEQPVKDISMACFQHLIRLIGGGTVTENEVVVPVNLIKRDTT